MVDRSRGANEPDRSASACPVGNTVTDRPERPASAVGDSVNDSLSESARRTAAASVPTEQQRVGWGFVLLYMLAYTGTSLLFLAPLLVSLALKVNDLVGIDAAPGRLALVTSVSSLLAMVANPFFGRLSDRTSSPWGMRRPWMVVGVAAGSLGILTVAFAPNITVVLLGWCTAQVFFNALLAALAAVMPDQVPTGQRGVVSGILAMCLPVASVVGTFLVQMFDQNVLTMLLVPCGVGGFFVVLFVARVDDRRSEPGQAPPWSVREFLGTFYVDPRRSPDFAWAFASRFLLVTGYAFLVTYQAYYLIQQVGSRQDDVPHQIYLGTLTQSVALVATALVIGRLSDHTSRRKIFVIVAALVYGLALFVIAGADDVNGYLAGMALGGVGFGMYMAVDLALVVDVLPDTDQAAKDLGVLNIAGALPFSLAPAIAPAVLSVRGGGYGVLFTVAGACAIAGAAAILPIKGVR
jgi:MFS family permease